MRSRFGGLSLSNVSYIAANCFKFLIGPRPHEAIGNARHQEVHDSRVYRSPRSKRTLTNFRKNGARRLRENIIEFGLRLTRPLFGTHDLGQQHRILDEVAALVDAGVLRTTSRKNSARSMQRICAGPTPLSKAATALAKWFLPVSDPIP